MFKDPTTVDPKGNFIELENFEWLEEEYELDPEFCEEFIPDWTPDHFMVGVSRTGKQIKTK